VSGRPGGIVVPLTRPLLGEVLGFARDLPPVPVLADHVLDACLRDGGACSGAYLAEGRPLIAAGLCPIWHGRWQAWMVVSLRAGPRHVVAVVRYLRRWLDREQPRHPSLRRVEMWVAADAPWRASFAAALGMRQEGRAEAWGPDGADHVLYARVMP
jgi:hypothetical protein